jgi:hypothetical protein
MPANLGVSTTSGIRSYAALFDQEILQTSMRPFHVTRTIRLTPEGHAVKPGYLYNLGNSFLCRFERSGYLSDIDEAISFHKDAIRRTPEGHAEKPGYLNNLGNSFLRRFESSEDIDDFGEAVGQFRLFATSLAGPPLDRFYAAIRWARLSSANNPVSSLEGYLVAINLLPRVVWLGQTISQRHETLALIGGIGNEAAAAATQSGMFEAALEWLEQGRSIVWGQVLNLRTPLDDLRVVQPKLADDLARVSKELDNAGTRDSYFNPSDRVVSESIEQVAQRHRRLADEWDSLVEQARAVPGFDDFLRPKKLPTLLKAAQYGPVITINAHKSRCDALILIPDHDEVIHLPLERFSYDQVVELQSSLHQSLLYANIRKRDVRGAKLVSRRGSGFDGILRALWSEIVKPVLDTLAFPASISF